MHACVRHRLQASAARPEVLSLTGVDIPLLPRDVRSDMRCSSAARLRAEDSRMRAHSPRHSVTMVLRCLDSTTTTCEGQARQLAPCAW